MSFLKSMWKNSSKHKKLNEEIALASSISDFTDSPLDIHDEEVSDEAIIFNLKYLGNTVMTSTTPPDDKSNKKLKLSKKSQMITTSAIKKVISASKSQKKVPDVTIAISPKGIETFNTVTEETLLKIPIYKISYCSIDAAHDTIFAFVSSTADKGSKTFEKSAQTFGSPESPSGQLESNSAFERAFQIYQNEQFLEEIRNKDSKNKENVETQNNVLNIEKLISDETKQQNDDVTKCLIDLGAENESQLNQFYTKDQSDEFSPTTWVSFE
ncbi:CLUMA_CG007689, isoform A [Clunio marinus]|uniref:CLUMA_CG007689, isoform A n=1 Tax=Clunio marinus TaxID=568069 RepID=A0A1J1I1L2_9DIPT|nr:CLUMA_CG007689, isoform A [Clunio marinus]